MLQRHLRVSHREMWPTSPFLWAIFCTELLLWAGCALQMLWNSSSNEDTALGQALWQNAFQIGVLCSNCYCCYDFQILQKGLCTESPYEILPGLSVISGGRLDSTKKRQNTVIQVFLLLKKTFNTWTKCSLPPILYFIWLYHVYSYFYL